jgi:hexosaminidase
MIRLSLLASAGLGLFLLAPARAEAIPDLMPLPATIIPGVGHLALDAPLLVLLSGPEDEIARAGAGRFADLLHRRTGVDVFVRHNGEDRARVQILVEWQTASPAIQEALEDESYSLEVTPQGAQLLAKSPLGVLHGLETLLQSIRRDSHGYSLPSLRIRDQPRFAWRGLLLDSARHFIPVPDLKRTLDAMAALKFNVFHWHLTDDQGFRFESKAFPKLTQAGSGGLYYSQEDVRVVVQFARERGIRVVPEFDMPGHTTSWFAAFPNLASAPGPYAVKPGAGLFEATMDPTRPELYQFLAGFFAEIAALFPDEYVHIGGDEVDPAQWRRNAAIQNFMQDHALRDEQALQAYFNRRLAELLARYGKKMIGWDEIIHADLPSDAVVQAWRGTGSLADAIRSGSSAILSFGYYLDQLQPASAHYLVDPLDGEAATLQSHERQRILGGEACLWTEYVSAENLDLRLWPRAAAIAERLWSRPEIRDTESMYRRLQAISAHLELLGVSPRTQRRAALERLAEGPSVSALEILLESLAPVRPENRVHDVERSLEQPLSRLVDLAEPESDAGRHLAQWVRNWADHREEICHLLEAWRDISGMVKPSLEASPFLAEAAPLADSVHSLSAAGLEAMKYLQQRRKPPHSWVTRQRELMERAAPPRADLVVTLVEPLRSLVTQAANPPR